jgi:two-component system NarL family sensor kinase
VSTGAGDGEPRLDPPLRSLALLRAGLLVAILVSTRLAHPRPATGGSFDVVAAIAAGYALAALALVIRGRPRMPWLVPAALDLAFVAALAHESGGASSELRWVLVLLPLGSVLALGPWRTGAFAAGALATYVAVALTGADPSTDAPAGFVLAHCLYIVWAGAVAVAVSAALARRGARAAALAASRGRLVAQALDAEERERRRLGEALHDDALQNLLAARQDLEEGASAANLKRAQAALEQTVTQLREAAFVLQSPVLQHLDIAHALDALAAQQARRGRFRTTVRVDEDAMGIDDQLMVSLGRELLVNAARHAGASEVSLVLRREDLSLLLEVRDDGCGFDEERRRSALREGHIGLASSAERVEALGGRLDITSAPGQGSEIVVSVPVTRERRRAPRPRREDGR